MKLFDLRVLPVFLAECRLLFDHAMDHAEKNALSNRFRVFRLHLSGGFLLQGSCLVRLLLCRLFPMSFFCFVVFSALSSLFPSRFRVSAWFGHTFRGFSIFCNMRKKKLVFSKEFRPSKDRKVVEQTPESTRVTFTPKLSDNSFVFFVYGFRLFRPILVLVI